LHQEASGLLVAWWWLSRRGWRGCRFLASRGSAKGRTPRPLLYSLNRRRCSNLKLCHAVAPARLTPYRGPKGWRARRFDSVPRFRVKAGARADQSLPAALVVRRLFPQECMEPSPALNTAARQGGSGMVVERSRRWSSRGFSIWICGQRWESPESDGSRLHTRAI
jgi:hypothetical protein